MMPRRPSQIVPVGTHGPRQIVPTAEFVARGLTSPIGAAPTAILVNHGGPVLGSVEVVPIYWGAAWTTGTNAQLASQLDGFFDFILTSSLIDMLSQYSTATTTIQHGKRLQSVRVSNSEPGTGGQVSDAQIQQALQTWIQNGTVPATTANTLYFIYLPPNVTSLAFGAQSCVAGGFCGYHQHIGGSVFYAVIPFVNCAGCEFPGNFLDTLTEVSSHELCEAITDPAASTWWDPNPFGNDPAGDEIGDICNRQTTRLGGFLIQTEWSNEQSACVIAPPALPGSADLVGFDATGRMNLDTGNAGWRTTWDIIVAGNFIMNGLNQILLYDRTGGSADLVGFDNTGRMNLDTGNAGWRTTWNLIVVGDFLGNGRDQILLYDRSSGSADLVGFDNTGRMNLDTGNTGWRTTWNIIVAGNFVGNRPDQILLYDRGR
jgi:hypothetical protein